MKNNELIDMLDRFKSGLLSQATDGAMDSNEYKAIRTIIINEPKLKNQDINFIKSNMTPMEFRRYMQGMFPHYFDRRQFITEKINSLISIIEEENNLVVYQKTGWDKIDESIDTLILDLNNINDRIDINEIGVRCRETIILLSEMVYDDSIHHPSDYEGDISPDDAKRKFDGYFEYKFKGSSNEEKRNFSKTCNK